MVIVRICGGGSALIVAKSHVVVQSAIEHRGISQGDSFGVTLLGGVEAVNAGLFVLGGYTHSRI